MVRRVQRDEAHAGQHRIPYQESNLIGHLVVRHVSPPDEHVGLIENLLRDAAVFILQGRRAHGEVLFLAEEFRDRPVDALGVDGGDGFLAALMLILVPNKYTYHNDSLRFKNLSSL